MNETFNLDELEDLYTDRSQVAEATARPTLRKGDYTAVIKSVTPRVAGEKSPFPGRRTVALRLDVADGDKTVTLWPEVSWELYRQVTVAGERHSLKPGQLGYDASAPMDKQSKLWAQLENIINPDGALGIKSVINELHGSTISVFVMEGFVGADGSIVWPETRANDYAGPDAYIEAYDEERKKFAQQGRLPKNFVSNSRKVKA